MRVKVTSAVGPPSNDLKQKTGKDVRLSEAEEEEEEEKTVGVSPKVANMASCFFPFHTKNSLTGASLFSALCVARV